MDQHKPDELKSFLEIPYDELEDMNLKAAQRAEKASAKELEHEYTAWLKKEKQSRPSRCVSRILKAAFTCSITTRNFFWSRWGI